MNAHFLIWEHGWQTAGWTMVYFLALGSLVALFAAALRRLSRRADPTLRYATSLAVFAALALMPVGIAIWLSQTPAGEYPLTILAPAAPPQVVDLAITPLETNSAVAELQTPTALPPSEPAEHGDMTTWTTAHAIEYLPWVWLAGTPLTFLLLASGLIGAERLRRTSQAVSDGRIRKTCDRLQTALNMGRLATVAICDRLATPLMVGIVRPLILLPPAALSGWSADELEMVLLHELAHVRRWDNLVNLLQRVVESVLFFHPAVWIVSRWVRLDREDCCDATVVALTAKPQAYAELLVALASTSHPLAGLAMARHPLAGRIRRILHLEDETMLVSRNTLVAISTALLAVVLAVSCYNPRETEALEATGKFATESTEQEGLTKDAARRLDKTMEAAVQRIRQLRVHGKKIALKLNEDNTLAVVAQGDAPPEALSEGSASNLLLKLAFEPSETNPVSLEVYEIPEHLRTYPGQLGDIFEGLELDPYGPQIKFHWEYHDDGKSVSISAPKLGLWFLEQFFAQTEKRLRDSKSASRVVPDPGARAISPFPTLEEQRAADVAYKLLNVELEKLTAEELDRVKAQGYQGGLRVATTGASLEGGQFTASGDLLVGLHVWPTPSLDAVSEILSRDDFDQLSPLKFYVIRRQPAENPPAEAFGGYGEEVGYGGGEMVDKLVTGRIQVNLDAWRSLRGQTNFTAPRPAPSLTAPRPLLSPGPIQPTESVVVSKQQKLLYDGKTFDEWRNSWKTELRTENRIECIKALAAFGRAGMGKEAAEAILEIVKEYDWNFIRSGTPGHLQMAAIGALGGETLGRGVEAIPSNDWLPVLTKGVLTGNKRIIMFAELVYPDAWISAMRNSDEEARQRINQVFKDMGPDAVPYVRQHLLSIESMGRTIPNTDGKVQTQETKISTAAADLLHEITGSDETAIEVLESVVGHNDTMYPRDLEQEKFLLERLKSRQEQ